VKKWLPKMKRGESGQAFLLVLVMLVVGSLLIVPSLTLASTSLKAGQMVEENMKGIYAADAGIEDALWRLINDKPASFPYNYEITGINGMSVSVVIEEVISISGQEIGSPGEHQDSLESTTSVSYDAGIYFYTMYLTNKCNSNIKIKKILIDFPPDLEYSIGSTSGNITSDDPAVYGSPNTGITLTWDMQTPYPAIEPGPDPGEGEYNTEAHTFQLSGPPDVVGVEGYGVVEANRQDIGTIWVEDSYAYSITAQSKDATDTIVATIRVGVWAGDELDISCWQLNP